MTSGLLYNTVRETERDVKLLGSDFFTFQNKEAYLTILESGSNLFLIHCFLLYVLHYIINTVCAKACLFSS